MASYAELFDQLPIDDIARKLGIDPDQAGQAISAAIPALLGGMKANAADPAGAASLTKALGDHAGSLPSSVDEVDLYDGEKIVRNVFGEQQDAVVHQLGGLGGLGGGLFSKLLPMLAPFLLSWLGGRIFGGGRRQQPAPVPQPQAQDDGGGLFGGIMDKILDRDDEPEYQAPARVPAPRQQDAGGVDIGSILNDMLGGGGSAAPQTRTGRGSQMPGGMGLDDLLGGVLGGLLGGGRR